MPLQGANFCCFHHVPNSGLQCDLCHQPLLHALRALNACPHVVLQAASINIGYGKKIYGKQLGSQQLLGAFSPLISHQTLSLQSPARSSC